MSSDPRKGSVRRSLAICGVIKMLPEGVVSSGGGRRKEM